MLILPIKKKWFDMILSGEKKEEYRDITAYYEVRFQNLFGGIVLNGPNLYKFLQGEDVPEEIRKEPIQTICFRNGYSNKSPIMFAKCTIRVGTGRVEWGAEAGKLYYVLQIKEILRSGVRGNQS